MVHACVRVRAITCVDSLAWAFAATQPRAAHCCVLSADCENQLEKLKFNTCKSDRWLRRGHHRMGRPDEVRHAMEERQRKWMSERSAEEARRDVQAELAAAAAARGARAPASAARGPPAGYSSHASAAQAAAARAHACTASDGHDGLAHSIGTPAELAGPGAHVVLDRITERLAQVRGRTAGHARRPPAAAGARDARARACWAGLRAARAHARASGPEPPPRPPHASLRARVYTRAEDAI